MGSNPAIPTKGTGVRAVAVLGAETAVGAAVLVALADSGFDVVPVADDEPLPDPVSAIIDAGPLRDAPAVTALAHLDLEGWMRTAEDPMRRALHLLQAAHRRLRERGGRIVVLLPSLVMTGAPGVASWVAAAEGYRSLAKAAARAWGAESIAIQCVLVPVATVSDAIAERPGLQPPATNRAPDPRADIGPAVAALLDDRLGAVTGLTLAVDGGVWMTS